MKRLTLAGLTVLLLAGCGSGVTSGDTGNGVEPSQVQEVCHNRVLDHLKAPSTADFGGDTVTGSEPNWYDDGYVDAENSFGAKIRTSYTCTAIHTGGINFSVKATLL